MAMSNSIQPGIRQLVVVDPDLHAYRTLVESAQSGELKLTLTSSGRSALRLLPSFIDATWVINTQLPDMSGFELLDMLFSLQHKLRAAVIDNEYDRDRELQALRQRAMQYVCKPMHPSWIDAWHGVEQGGKNGAEKGVGADGPASHTRTPSSLPGQSTQPSATATNS